MKYSLNKLPVKTTNNFKVNDVVLDLDLPSFLTRPEFTLKGDTSSLIIQKENVVQTISSRIGLDLDSYEKVEITVPKGVDIKEPIFLSYEFQKEDALVTKLLIQYEENSHCDFIIHLSSKDKNIHFSHFLENVLSKKNSCGNITFINLLNSKSTSFYALENRVEENAEITHTILDLGGNTRVYNAYSELTEYKAQNTLNTIYIGLEDQVLDFNYYLKNIGRETNNQMRVEGALGEKSNKIFRGTIDFIKGCSQSVGEENENCVLLSDTCRSRSLPELLCEEEDVVGSHGVSSGKVDEDKLFYIMSRGYNKKEAEKLIVLANFYHLLDKIPSVEVRDELLSKIEDLLK